MKEGPNVAEIEYSKKTRIAFEKIEVVRRKISPGYLVG